eukprot:SAG22_NODE_9289_length_598_cov_1.653307_1_plen_181_part_01
MVTIRVNVKDVVRSTGTAGLCRTILKNFSNCKDVVRSTGTAGLCRTILKNFSNCKDVVRSTGTALWQTLLALRGVRSLDRQAMRRGLVREEHPLCVLWQAFDFWVVFVLKHRSCTERFVPNSSVLPKHSSSPIDEVVEGAIKIQATWRRQNASAIKIQATWRGTDCRLDYYGLDYYGLDLL